MFHSIQFGIIFCHDVHVACIVQIVTLKLDIYFFNFLGKETKCNKNVSKVFSYVKTIIIIAFSGI